MRFLSALLLLLASAPAFAFGAPEWLRAAAQEPLPKYADDVSGVVLLDEKVTTVTDSGEIRTVYRKAYKILGTRGRDLGVVPVYFDNETKIKNLKGWCIPAQGQEFEVKEKDAVETTAFSGVLFEDTRYKVLHIPASEPGSVIGYEFEQRRRPNVLNDTWVFQDNIPVRHSRYTLILPSGWEVETFWANSAAKAPTIAGTQYSWEASDVPALKPEPDMPARHAVQGRMLVNFIPTDAEMKGRVHTSWKDVGSWYYGLLQGRQESTPAMQQEENNLLSGKTGFLDKVRAIGTFAQHDVRYVAIEIGIGGYQPHAAADIFANRYGDCKDKVTLMGSMLRHAGIDSFYVLVNSDRGVVFTDFPSMSSFNHVIIAIRVPNDVSTEGLQSVITHPQLGKLLLFDPTSELTPLGLLPESLQGSSGLVVTQSGGDLVAMPMQNPEANRLQRTAKLTLLPDGSLQGEVREVRTGASASSYRSSLMELQEPQRVKFVENFLASFLHAFKVTGLTFENLNDANKDLVVRYTFEAQSYAKSVGGLMLVRPRVFGSKSEGIYDLKERKYDVELDAPAFQTDDFEITLPSNYSVDELPRGVDLQGPVGSYSSTTTATGNTLSYKRQYVIKQVHVPVKDLDQLNRFFSGIIADEKSSAVLAMK